MKLSDCGHYLAHPRINPPEYFRDAPNCGECHDVGLTDADDCSSYCGCEAGDELAEEDQGRYGR